MAIPQKALDSMKKKVSKWRIFSRTTQVLLTLVVLGLDIFVMEQWSKNQWDFNSAVGNTTNNTYVGGTPFTGIVLFTALLTLGVILYDELVYRTADIFYQVRAEIVLELLTAIFWGASFGGMASYISEISVLTSILEGYDGAFDDVLTKTQTSQSACIVIVIFGCVEFVLALTNLAIFIVDTVKEAEIAKSGGGNQDATVAGGYPVELNQTLRPFDSRAESYGIGAEP